MFDLIWRLNGILPKDVAIAELVNVDNRFMPGTRPVGARLYRILNKPQRSALFTILTLLVRQPRPSSCRCRSQAGWAS